MKLYLTALLALLSACTTTQVHVPEHLLHGPAIVVSRDEGYGWSGRNVQVFVDGSPIGTPTQGTHVSKRVTPGQHRVRFVDSILGVTQADRAQLVDVDTKAVLFRVGFNDGGMFIDRER